MRLHANARSSPHTRRLLVTRVVQEGWPVGLAAKAVGLSRKAARKWIERFRTEGEAGLLDRSSAPRSIPHRTSKQVVSRVLALRHKRLVAWAIAEQLGMPRSTIGAILRRHGLGRLSALDPKVPVIRYERENPGELIHLDTKKLARIQRIGHRIHGDRRRMCRGVGWEFAHLAIDDHTRLSYVEVLSDEGGETTASFLERALGFFGRHKIRVERLLTDNGSGYRSHAVNAVCYQPASVICGPSRTPHGPTARPSGLCRLCYVSGRTDGPTAAPRNGASLSKATSITTITDDPMRPSDTSHRSCGSETATNLPSLNI